MTEESQMSRLTEQTKILTRVSTKQLFFCASRENQEISSSEEGDS